MKKKVINASFLVGKEFKLLEEGSIIVEKGIIKEIKERYSKDGMDFREYVVMPSLINSHTHVGDSFAKEAVLGLDVEKAVGPNGKKWELYANAKEEEISASIKESVEYMLSLGITTFVDFRENGQKGVNLLKNSIKNLPIRAVILGRGDINIDSCDGFGMNLSDINKISKIKKMLNGKEGKILAIHAGEVNGEVKKALNFEPDIIVHFTKVSEKEIKIAKGMKDKLSVVVCPRSNAVLGVGIPPVKELVDAGINVALGTDNVMINSPNLWREMEFLSKISYLSRAISPKEILSMVTTNAAKMLKMNTGSIEKGKNADLIFLDKNAKNLHRSKNILATIIHRCDGENIRKVMLNGEFIIDKEKNKRNE